MKKIGLSLTLLVFIVFLCVPMFAICETTLYVCVSDFLVGRAEPNKNSSKEARFYPGEELVPLSIDGEWVEVEGGETGTVWCNARYLSEISEPRRYTNTSGGRVFIRPEPLEKKKNTGVVAAGETVTIKRVVMGWGFIGDNKWVNMDFFEEE